MPEQTFVFRARLVRVVDGDTLDLVIDQGMHCHRIERVRLLGINTPEVRGESREAGKAATEFVESWRLRTIANFRGDPVEWPLVIQTEKDDAFGRYLAHVWCARTGEYLNGEILAAGHAVVYNK